MHCVFIFLVSALTWPCPSVTGLATQDLTVETWSPPSVTPLRKIALVGDNAPGFRNGVTLVAIGGLQNLFGKQPEVVMNGDGEVAFFALLQGPGIVGGEEEGSNSVTLWRALADGLSLVVQQGDPIPGSPGETFTAFPPMAPFPGFALADTPDIHSRRVVFSATGGLYVHTDAGIAPVDLTSPPVGLPPTSSFASLAIVTPHAEPDDSVLFVTEYVVPFSSETVTCLVRGRTDMAAEVLLAEGLPVSGVGLPPDVVVAELPYITSILGGVGFAFPEDTTDGFAVVVRLSGPGIADDNNDALLAYENGSFRIVAREGSLAPGTGAGGIWGFSTFSTVFGIGMPAISNAQGKVAFPGDFTGGVAPSSLGVGVWTDRSGLLEKLAIADEVCTSNPGGPFGEPVPGKPNFVFSGFIGGDFNDAGHIALLANVIDSTISPVAACLSGPVPVVMTDISGQLDLTLERGHSLPGDGVDVVLSSFIGQPRLTHNDHVVVVTIVSGPGITGANNLWILTVGPDGNVRTLLRRGDPVDLGGGDVRTITGAVLGRGVSSDNEIPVTIFFADNTAGVFALRVTDPIDQLGR